MLIKDTNSYISAKTFNLTHFSFLDQISIPLESYFGFKLFTYRRVYDDGSIFHLSSNSDWIENCFEKELWFSQKMLERASIMQLYETQQFLWVHDFTDPLYAALYEYNIWNGTSFYKKYQNYIELIAFASTCQNNQIMEFYSSQSHVIQQFIYYFKEKANHLLEEAGKYRLPLIKTIGNTVVQPLISQQTNKFLKETIPSRYYVTDQQYGYLTHQEMNIVKLLLQRKTSKEIGKILSVSYRTVEKHMEAVRKKFGLFTTSQMVSFFNQTL